MASQNDKKSRVRPVTAISAGVMGVVTASVGIIAPPAFADNYPSWNDVQQAKANVTQQQAMIANITKLIAGLQTAVDQARIDSEKAAEAYFQAKDALDAATAKAADLKKQADAAAAKAKTSQMRAGLLASHLAKTGGGGDPTVDLLLNGGGDGSGADKLLYQLGTMSKLTQQSQDVYAEATKDKNTATALTDQANVAKTEREKLAEAASVALAAAQAAQTKAQAALATQQTKSTELIAQLATLKNTSAQVESAYLVGEAKRKAAEEAARQAEIRRQQALAAQQAASRPSRTRTTAAAEAVAAVAAERSRPRTATSCRPRSTTPTRSWASRTSSAARGPAATTAPASR